MCWRFTIQYTWAEYYEALNLIPADAKGRNDPPRYNVCPTQTVGMVCADKDAIVVKDARWGLVPHWAKDLKIKPMINARSETVTEKPIFKSSFASRRCLIPANSFYEWDRKSDPDTPLPYNIHLKDNRPFFFGGIWRYRKHLDVTSCAIFTMEPHENIALCP
ncbi:SOS response-associated peptidase [Hoeflea sp.]|uniref:SOS response-associated peptidase n=1 Tax=Hoeflea sp. TaxID=1940281 RepID=UPI003B02BB3E